MPRPVLSPHELRVLGCLLEKERTTPEQYPLTLNALLAACNQRSNREPVLALSETQVADAVDALRHEALVWRSESARSERYEHMLERRWELKAPGRAVMALLLLRGPQTAAELRSRSERLHTFGSVAEVEAVLGELARRGEPLVRELARRPGQREARWVQLAGGEPAEPVQSSEAAEPGPGLASDPGTTLSLSARVAALETEVARLSAELAALRSALGGEG